MENMFEGKIDEQEQTHILESLSIRKAVSDKSKHGVCDAIVGEGEFLE